MSPLLHLQPRDRELLQALAQQVRLFSQRQIADHFWDGALPNARRRMKRLAERGLVSKITVQARTAPPLESPLASWRPGDSVPEFGQIAYRCQARWRLRPVRPCTTWVVTEQGAQHFGGVRRGPLQHPTQATHDLGVAAVWLRLRQIAPQTKRECPVFLVIDEFQRMVASNLEYMLQLARSMGVGVILANQSMQDLHKGNTNLIPAIEANCRLRQWFSVSSTDDQERLIRSGGETVELSSSWSQSTTADGKTSTTQTQSEQILPRLTINDILLTNDHPLRSILRISRGAGYSQYGGFPVVIETQYHISAAEYDRRKALSWPAAAGAFAPRCEGPAEGARLNSGGALPPRSEAPQWSEEIIGPTAGVPLTPAMKDSITQLFDALAQELSTTTPTPQRRRRR